MTIVKIKWVLRLTMTTNACIFYYTQNSTKAVIYNT